MNKRDQHLEDCLMRLAAGESVTDCLADYPQDADWLRPLLTTAQQLHTLPAPQPRPAADLSIQQQLRQAAQQSNAASSPPLPIHFMEDPMKNMSRFLLRWLPRVLVGGTAVALLIIFIAQFANPLAFFSSQAVEPAVEPVPANVTIIGNTSITREANLSPDASEAPLYRARLEPIPTTVAEAVAWAQTFGLSDPQPYRPFNERDPGIIVLGSDGQSLAFQDFGSFREISYANSTASLLTNTGANAPLPFDEAADIAVAFLRDHEFLPADYQVEPAIGSSGSIQQVIVRPQAEGGIIGDDTSPGSASRVHVDTAGQVIFASLSRLVLEADGTIPIISSQAAYDDLLNNRNVVRSIYSTAVGSSTEDSRSYQPPPPTWNSGQTVDLTGYPNALVHAETGALHVTLTEPNGVTYQLSGSDLAELSDQSHRGAVRVQGTITGQEASGSWQVAVTNWQAVSPEASYTPCLVGSLMGTGDAARFRSQAGDEYSLPQAPTDIADGEVIEVCAAPAEPGEALTWYSIHIPPRESGPPPGGMVTRADGGRRDGGSGCDPRCGRGSRGSRRFRYCPRCTAATANGRYAP
ncbi:MAG: proprotein convertase P-domain-containing protein [Chloroflexi bacterium]|nr:proprotein convertase P-domain-containing protein [Chloroflexota bacterium]